MRSSWSVIYAMSTIGRETSAPLRARQRISYQDEYVLLSVTALQLLQKTEVEKRICLAVGQVERLDFSPRLPVDLLEESELVRRYQAGPLVSLHMPSSVKVGAIQ